VTPATSSAVATCYKIEKDLDCERDPHDVHSRVLIALVTATALLQGIYQTGKMFSRVHRYSAIYRQQHG